jgi:hypothetical protein
MDARRISPRELLPLLVGAVLIPAVLGSSATIFNDGDVSWHIATGAWMLDHGAIPTTDPFSFTWGGKPWVPIEWLAELIFAGAYRLAGYSGVAALVTAALMALHALVFFNAVRFVRPWVAVGTIVAMDLVLIPMLLARPHTLSWVLLALWTWLLLRARGQGRAPPIASALLMALWANLHGSFLVGLLVAAAFGLEALLTEPDRGQQIRRWAVFGLACGLAVLINAHGIAGVVHPFKMVNLAMLPLINEWKPSSFAVTPAFFAVLAAVLLLWAVKRPRLQPVRAGLLLLLLGMALLQMRHQALLAILAAMLLPPAFDSRSSADESFTFRQLPVPLAAIVLLVLVRAAMPMTLPYNSANPWKLIAAVPAELRSQPVINGYSMGGPLILSGIRPYIDGRGDMYGDELVLGYKRILEGDPAGLTEAERRYGVRWAMLPVGSRKLIALLDRSGWRPIYRDEVGVIYVRP